MQTATILSSISDITHNSSQSPIANGAPGAEAAFGSEPAVIIIGLILLGIGSFTFLAKLCKSLAASANK